MLNRSDENEHLCFVADLRVKTIQSLIIQYDVECEYFLDTLYQDKSVSSISSLLRIFNMNMCQILSNFLLDQMI